MLAPALARRLARGRRLRLRDLIAAPALELGLDVVVDPLGVPPLHRQDGDALQIDAVVQMIAAREAGLPRPAEDLPLLDRLAVLDLDRAQMAVKREQAKAVIEDDRIPIDAQVARENDLPAVRGFDRISLGD